MSTYTDTIHTCAQGIYEAQQHIRASQKWKHITQWDAMAVLAFGQLNVLLHEIKVNHNIGPLRVTDTKDGSEADPVVAGPEQGEGNAQPQPKEFKEIVEAVMEVVNEWAENDTWLTSDGPDSLNLDTTLLRKRLEALPALSNLGEGMSATEIERLVKEEEDRVKAIAAPGDNVDTYILGFRGALLKLRDKGYLSRSK